MGRHASGPAPDPEDEARLLFRVEQLDKQTERTSLLMLPGAVVLAIGAWAIDRYTQPVLGAWRYAFVVPLTLLAACGGILGVVLAAVFLWSKASAGGAPRWFTRAVTDLFSGLLAVLVVGLVVSSIYQLTGQYPGGVPFPLTVGAAAFAAGATTSHVRRHHLYRELRKIDSSRIESTQIEAKR